MPNRPTPSRLAALRGNPGKRARNTREPMPKVKIPTAPPYLDAYAKTEWRRITKQLGAVELLSDMDRAVLAAYCQAVSEQREALLQMQRDGRYIENAQGVPVRAPWLLTYEKATDAMRKLASEFGLTPAARSRVQVGGAPEEEDDPLAVARKKRDASRAA